MKKIKIKTFDWKASPGDVIEFVVKNPGYFREVGSDGDFYVLAQCSEPFTQKEGRKKFEDYEKRY
jgi:hypothetical protein